MKKLSGRWWGHEWIHSWIRNTTHEGHIPNHDMKSWSGQYPHCDSNMGMSVWRHWYSLVQNFGGDLYPVTLLHTDRLPSLPHWKAWKTREHAPDWLWGRGYLLGVPEWNGLQLHKSLCMVHYAPVAPLPPHKQRSWAAFPSPSSSCPSSELIQSAKTLCGTVSPHGTMQMAFNICHV